MVVDGQLWNDSYKGEPFGKVNYQFQFFDSDNKVLFERDLSLTDNLPIDGGFIIPPGVALPFHIVIKDVDKDVLSKISYVSSGGNNTLDYFSWKPADLKMSLEKTERVTTIFSKTSQDMFYKWKISGSITNTHSEKIQDIYVVASLLEGDRFLGTAGYLPEDIQPITLDGHETKSFEIHSILPEYMTPDSVSLYAESEKSSTIHQHYKPIIMKNLAYAGLFSDDPRKPVIISANVTNLSRQDLSFDWIVQIIKSPKTPEGDLTKYPDSKVEQIEIIPSHIEAQKSIQLGYSWIPQGNGIYFYEMYIWDNFIPISYPFTGDFLTSDWIYVSSNLNSIKDQLKSGIPLNEVKCKKGLQLFIQNWTGDMICIKDTSIEKLKLRNYLYDGFGSSGEEIKSNNPSQVQFNAMNIANETASKYGVFP